MLLLRISRILFSLALALYLGGIITLGAIVVPALAQTVRQDHITYPALPPGLDMDRQTIGQLFGPALARFQYVELACAALMVLALALETKSNAGILPASSLPTSQTSQTDLSRRAPVFRQPFPLTLKLRSLLMLLLLALLAYDLFILSPNVWHTLADWRTATLQNPAAAHGMLEDQFNSLHKSSELLGQAKAYTLLALLILTAWNTSPGNPPPSSSVKSDILPLP